MAWERIAAAYSGKTEKGADCFKGRFDNNAGGLSGLDIVVVQTENRATGETGPDLVIYAQPEKAKPQGRTSGPMTLAERKDARGG